MTDLTALKDNLAMLRGREHFARQWANHCCLKATLAEREYAQASEAVRVAEAELASAKRETFLTQFRGEQP